MELCACLSQEQTPYLCISRSLTRDPWTLTPVCGDRMEQLIQKTLCRHRKDRKVLSPRRSSACPTLWVLLGRQGRAGGVGSLQAGMELGWEQLGWASSVPSAPVSDPDLQRGPCDGAQTGTRAPGLPEGLQLRPPCCQIRDLYPLTRRETPAIRAVLSPRWLCHVLCGQCRALQETWSLNSFIRTQFGPTDLHTEHGAPQLCSLGWGTGRRNSLGLL